MKVIKKAMAIETKGPLAELNICKEIIDTIKIIIMYLSLSFLVLISMEKNNARYGKRKWPTKFG